MSEEVEKERVMLSKEEAKDLLQVNGEEGDKVVHVFVNSKGMMLGSDWSVKSAHEFIDESFEREIGGPGCMGMGHGLVVFPKDAEFQNEIRFMEHDKEKMKKYD